MTDYKDRFKEEYRQLYWRIDRLERFLCDKNGSEWELHQQQLCYMKKYLNVLVARSVKENIQLQTGE